MTSSRLSTCAFLFLGAGLVGLSPAEPRVARDGGEDQAGVVAIKLPLRSTSVRPSTGEPHRQKRTPLDPSSPASPLRVTPPALVAILTGNQERPRAAVQVALPWQSAVPALSESDQVTHRPLPFDPAAAPFATQIDLQRQAKTELASRRAQYPDHQQYRFTDNWEFMRGCLRAPDGIEA
ncbi:hypothetical protein [Verrucomicrobium sp. BvORR034]|uniref:hypothetical protein n=1 Tax=Verrucomicrobium sp. BvORR034 TaxID=1396418 RepID=UPI0006784888|nr:hypothetical protein [Verrucomicrobium sp. BvORR034]